MEKYKINLLYHTPRVVDCGKLLQIKPEPEPTRKEAFFADLRNLLEWAFPVLLTLSSLSAIFGILYWAKYY